VEKTTQYQVEQRAGGPMIERLNNASLEACAIVTRRGVMQLLSDNGYERPVNIASDDVLGG
jgi:hypothetical protein